MEPHSIHNTSGEISLFDSLRFEPEATRAGKDERPQFKLPDITDSQSIFSQKRRVEPNLPDMNTPYGVGKFYEQNREYQLATQWYTESIRRGDRVVSAILDAAGIFSKYGDCRRAIQYMDEHRFLIPSEKGGSFHRLYQRLEWDIYRPPNRMTKVVSVTILDKAYAPLDYKLCAGIFSNPEKVRKIVRFESGLGGYVEFDSHSAARKAVGMTKSAAVSVRWPDPSGVYLIENPDTVKPTPFTERSPTIVDTSDSTTTSSRSVSGDFFEINPELVTVPNDWEPPLYIEEDSGTVYIRNVMHCVQFEPSATGRAMEPNWAYPWLELGSIAETSGYSDIAFKIYGLVALKAYPPGSPLNSAVIDARVRMSWLIARDIGNFDLANDFLVFESISLSRFLTTFTASASPARDKFVSSLIQTADSLLIGNIFSVDGFHAATGLSHHGQHKRNFKSAIQ
jgi:hypothetical protein